MSKKSLVTQLNEYRPDMPKAETVGLAEVFSRKLQTSRTLDPKRSDVEVLYEDRVRYLHDNPADISLVELTKASATKEKVEVSVGDEFCRLMASFAQKPVELVDGVEVLDPKRESGR